MMFIYGLVIYNEKVSIKVLCFFYILAPIKATEIVFIWEDRRDPTVCFEYKTDSERYICEKKCTVAEILAKWFGASIS